MMSGCDKVMIIFLVLCSSIKMLLATDHWPQKFVRGCFGAFGVTDSCCSALSYASSVFSLCHMNYGASDQVAMGRTVITGWSEALTCV